MLRPIAMIALALLGQGSTPTIKFTKGETIQYKTSLTGSRSASFKGSTQAMSFSGGGKMTLRVTSGGASSASMTVANTDSYAKATVTALPPEMKSKKAEIEKAASDALRRGMLAGGRTQSVTSRGTTTYTIPLGDGKSMTISDGAFMMLVLPNGALASGRTWSANVRLPIPDATGAMKVTYRYAGATTYAGQSAHKITFSAKESDSKSQGDITAKMTADLTGSVMLSASGKVLYGEVRREATTTLVHKTQGTRTAKQSSTQTFTKM